MSQITSVYVMEAVLELASRRDKRQEIRNLESHYISMIAQVRSPPEKPLLAHGKAWLQLGH